MELKSTDAKAPLEQETEREAGIVSLPANHSKWVRCLDDEYRARQWLMPRGRFETLEACTVLHNRVAAEVAAQRWTVGQLAGLRQWLLVHNCLKAHAALLRQVSRAYERGVPLHKLVWRYHVSPLTAARGILRERQHDSKQVRKQLLNLSTLTSERDRQEFAWAIQVDSAAPLHQTKQMDDARTFETQVAHWLQVHGVHYATEADIKESRRQEDRQPGPTPDFVLDENAHVTYEQKRIRWIEVKNFYGCGSVSSARRFVSQVQRYCDAWGPGVLVFAAGYCDALQQYLPKDVYLMAAGDAFVLPSKMETAV